MLETFISGAAMGAIVAAAVTFWLCWIEVKHYKNQEQHWFDRCMERRDENQALQDCLNKIREVLDAEESE